MKFGYTLIFFLGLLHLAPALSQDGISQAEITFTFVSKDVEGSISGFESTSNIDLNNLVQSSFSGSVAVETLKTGNFLRDWSLKGKKYFNADEYPQIHFKSTSVSSTHTGVEVKGILTLKGKSEEIQILFNRNGNELKGTTTLFTSDFGISVKKKRMDNEVVVHFLFTL